MTPSSRRALHHDIDQSPWYVDHLARLAAGEGLGDLGLGQDAFSRVGFREIDREQQAVAHLAVDLDHDFDGIVLGQRRVVLRPRLMVDGVGIPRRSHSSSAT
jgi:hypothetical protein